MLFDDLDEPDARENAHPIADAGIRPPAVPAPLADRVRPQTLDEIAGQTHLIGGGRWLRRVVEQGGVLPSLILWGPPGTGKTTLARILARATGARFATLSAVLSGVKELREAIADAKRHHQRGERTVLFIDEIHRFNKAQQDALLPAVEEGVVTLIGATTENPSFEVIGALLSRSRVLELKALQENDVLQVLQRALAHSESGLVDLRLEWEEGVLDQLARSSGGDARVALGALEAAVAATHEDARGRRLVSREAIREALGRARYAYDKLGEDHYNLISAMIKSVRNSDVDASLYWLARLIEGGADPMFIARRLCILASEDVGLAAPELLVQAAAAAQITHLIGLPEALYPLAQATIALARAPKSNAVGRAYQAAAADAERTAREPVPLHLRNAVTSLMHAAGYGAGYRSIHDDPEARTEMTCRPHALEGRVYFSNEPEPPHRATGKTNGM
jgi:putative ATPase